MTPEQQSQELRQAGADPFEIAALALEQNKRLQARTRDLQQRLQEIQEEALLRR